MALCGLLSVQLSTFCSSYAGYCACCEQVQEPEKCDGCGAKFSLALIHNLSAFTNKQMVKMQVRRRGGE